MTSVDKLIEKLSEELKDKQKNPLISYDDLLKKISDDPKTNLRNVFQLFHDFIYAYLGEGVDEYYDDSESIGYSKYDTNKLFVEGTDNPFFADRLFANNLVNLADSFRRGAQQNKIYLFEGPPGSGKSTFLNTLLMKLEEYTKSHSGVMLETVWKLDKNKLGWSAESPDEPDPNNKEKQHSEYLEIPCPSHDHPILMIPKSHRREFLEDLITDEEFKKRLFNAKEYEWVLKWNPCTICTSLYHALLEKLESPEEVFEMLSARNYHYSRMLGEGISVFNAGDAQPPPPMRNIITNQAIQDQLAELFGDSNKVQYLYSRYAKTNNGVYALMDIKQSNVQRLLNLHGIISEGVHKVGDIEENVHSLFLAVLNPEDREEIDKDNQKERKAFADRLDYERLAYVLDYKTEVEIYKNIFGERIEKHFLPRVLNNFAKVVMSSRLNPHSEGLKKWIKKPIRYAHYCDENLLLLKMDIYSGDIPSWLSEEDRKSFVAEVRKQVIKEAEDEGFKGISGRKSIEFFNEFFSSYAKEGKIINMAMLEEFFCKNKETSESVPEEFLESLINLYDYNLLHEVKESMYYYNENKISRDIQNYLYAINFYIKNNKEEQQKVKCVYTGKVLDITEGFFRTIEERLLGVGSDLKRKSFREYTQKEYVSETLIQEMQLKGKDITDTKLYQKLFKKYVYNLKENVLDPFIENPNFRNAIKEYNAKGFKTYDKRIRDDVHFLMGNLKKKYGYTEEGAMEVCIYLVDKDLVKKFAKPKNTTKRGKGDKKMFSLGI